MAEDIFNLAGKTAIVWGGGQGMGERSAIRLAEAGCQVAVVDLERERAERICEEIRGLGSRAIPLVADVTEEEQVNAVVETTNLELDVVDCMVTVVGTAFWFQSMVAGWPNTLFAVGHEVAMTVTWVLGEHSSASENAPCMHPSPR